MQYYCKAPGFLLEAKLVPQNIKGQQLSQSSQHRLSQLKHVTI